MISRVQLRWRAPYIPPTISINGHRGIQVTAGNHGNLRLSLSDMDDHWTRCISNYALPAYIVLIVLKMRDFVRGYRYDRTGTLRHRGSKSLRSVSFRALAAQCPRHRCPPESIGARPTTSCCCCFGRLSPTVVWGFIMQIVLPLCLPQEATGDPQ